MKSKCRRRLRIAALVFATLVALLAAYIHVIGRDIAPADFSDLALPPQGPILPEDNAYTYFRKAADALVSYPDKYGDLTSAASYLARNHTNSTLIAKVLSDNEEVFQYLRQGIQCQHCVFPVPTSIEDLPNISGLLTMHTLLLYKIRHEQASGNIDVALQDVSSFLRYGQLIRQTPSVLIVWLVGLAIETSSLQAAQQLAQNPQLSEHHINFLLNSVNDIPPYDASLSDVMKAEFQYNVMALENTSKRGLFYACICNGVSSRFIFRHNFLLNQTIWELANRYRLLISEVTKFYSDVTSRVKFELRHHDNHLTLWEIFLIKNSIGKTALDQMTEPTMYQLETRCRMDANLAATKLIIACHLFQRETGRKPQSLEELVPTYLPSIPLDPFDGKPFRYNPEKGVVYSVGTSLDDLGGETGRGTPPQDFGEIWRGKNAVFKIWED